MSRLLPTPPDAPGMAESAADEPGGARRVSTDRHVAWLAWARNSGGLSPGLRVGPADGPMARVGPAPAWDPHWVGGRIWFVGEEGGWPRLGSMQPDGTGVDWHTAAAPGLRELDVAADGRAVFVRDGALRVWGPGTGEVDVPVSLPAGVSIRTDPVPVLGPGATLVAQGAPDRVGVVRRGQILVHDGRGLRLETHARAGVRLGPASFVGDAVLTQAHDGATAHLVWSRPRRARDRALGAPLVAPLVALVGSPDGRSAAAVDTRRGVWWIDLETGERRLLGRSALEAPDPRLAWRAEGRWLAFVLRDARGQRGVFLSDGSGSALRLGDGRVDAHAPTWITGGAALAFLAEQAPDIVLDHRDVAFVARHAAVPMAAPVDLSGAPGRPRPAGPGGPWEDLLEVDGVLLGMQDGSLLPVAGATPEPWAVGVGPCSVETGICLSGAGFVRPGVAGGLALGVPDPPELAVDRRGEWRQLVGEACGQAARHRWDQPGDGAARL